MKTVKNLKKMAINDYFNIFFSIFSIVLFKGLLQILLSLIPTPLKAQSEKWDIIMETNDEYLSQEIKFEWGTDPFIKTPGSLILTETEIAPTLSSILYSKTHSTAFLDGKPVSVNSMVRNRRVVEIGQNYVLLEKKDSLIEVKIPPIMNKKTVEIIKTNIQGQKQ